MILYASLLLALVATFLVARRVESRFTPLVFGAFVVVGFLLAILLRR